MFKNPLCLFILCFFGMIACSKRTPLQVSEAFVLQYTYTPEISRYTTENGVEVVFDQPKYAEGEVALRITVINTSSDTIKIDPLHWNFIARDEGYDNPGYFYDPVQRLDELKQEARINKHAWWLTPIAAAAKLGFGMASQAAFGAIDDESGLGNMTEGTTGLVKGTAAAPGKVRKAKQAKLELEFWERALFMPTELAPEQYKKGIVFFKTDPNASYYDLYLKIGEESVNHKLEQRLVK